MSPRPIKNAQIINKTVKNFMVGRKGYEPQAIVIHTADGNMNETYLNYQSKSTKHSAHYMVGKKGEIWQFAKDEDTTWHCGGVASPTWTLIKPKIDPNLYTIGIDHEGHPSESWTEKTYISSAWLIQKITKKWKIPLDQEHIIPHSKINQLTHADCPGPGVNIFKLIELAKQYSDQVNIPELDALSHLETQNELRNQLSILILENTSLKEEIQKLEKILQSKKETNMKNIASKNVQLSTEVYRLQQLQIKADRQLQQLVQDNSKLRQLAGEQLKTYPTGQIFKALIAKILRR